MRERAAAPEPAKVEPASRGGPLAPFGSTIGISGRLLALQRTAGNHVVNLLLRQGALVQRTIDKTVDTHVAENGGTLTKQVLGLYLQNIVKPECKAFAGEKERTWVWDTYVSVVNEWKAFAAATPAAQLQSFVDSSLKPLVDMTNDACVTRGTAAGKAQAATEAKWAEKEKRAKPVEEEKKSESKEKGTGGGDLVLLDEKDEQPITIILDTHQNKHQTTMIPELGAWKSKMGSRFAAGKGKDWHTKNTAEAMKTWALGLIGANELPPGTSKYASKTEPIGGIIYDAKAIRGVDGHVTVVYHCNPPKDE